MCSNDNLIELKYRKSTYYIRSDRNQWLLSRGRSWNKKTNEWSYRGTTYFCELLNLISELEAEELRISDYATLADLRQNQMDIHAWLQEQLPSIKPQPSSESDSQRAVV